MPLLLALLAATSACDSAERQEASTMLHALELLQAADQDSRPRLLQALEETPSKGKPAEYARETCVRAYRALDEATRAARALPDGGLPKALDQDARELLETLRRADEQLKTANQLLPECREAMQALRQSVQ